MFSVNKLKEQNNYELFKDLLYYYEDKFSNTTLRSRHNINIFLKKK